MRTEKASKAEVTMFAPGVASAEIKEAEVPESVAGDALGESGT